MSLAFDFGRNWQNFSAAKLSRERFRDAVESLRQLGIAQTMKGRTVLDIGCGSGLFSIAAAQCGAARVVGFDISQNAIDVSQGNLKRLSSEIAQAVTPQFRVGNILDEALLAELGAFNLVYAWGVLHHTGAMWQAIRNAASIVEQEDGLLMLAIYNRHWTSPFWRHVKRIYNLSPRLARESLDHLFSMLLYISVALATRQNPLQKARGMDFWYDVVDWLGGYPYEYASKSEIIDFVQGLGFEVVLVAEPRVPTGCNEFVFRRPSAPQGPDAPAHQMGS